MFEYEARKIKQLGPVTCVVTRDGEEEELENYGFHSPDGFQIGYSGSGPADLAYSILVDYYIRTGTDETKARRVALNTYQEFKTDFIVPAVAFLQVNDMTITGWLKKVAKKVEVQ